MCRPKLLASFATSKLNVVRPLASHALGERGYEWLRWARSFRNPITFRKPFQVKSKLAITAFFFLSHLQVMVEIDLLQAEEKVALSGEALIVVGAGGADEYYDEFKRWAENWRLAFSKRVKTTMIGGHAESTDAINERPVTDRQRLLDWIADEPEASVSERWIILIGHGTYQLNVAKFNLEGPDLSSDDLAKAIASSQSRWRIFVCSSCSGPFINALSGPNRIIVTATKSGSEQNYSRFGDYFSRSIGVSTSDLDHDGSVSILEAFLVASRGLSNWYVEEGRLASEQALIDDNGDKRGTPANFFRGVRAAKAPTDGLKVDGRFANRVFVDNPLEVTSLTPERQALVADLEQKIDALREQKSAIEEASYYAQLEHLMLELAKVLIPNVSDSNSKTSS